jgi:hypothetical protein
LKLQSERPPLLLGIKLLHTAIWLFFAGCIVAIPIAGARHQFRWAAVLSGMVWAECAVLLLNRGRCPLTDLASRCTDLSMTGRPVTPNDENGPLVPQHRTANEERGQCQRAVDGPMAALSIRGSVLAAAARASAAESASAFSEQQRADNFDIYLPLWLARRNKVIFGTLFAVGELLVLALWLISQT